MKRANYDKFLLTISMDCYAASIVPLASEDVIGDVSLSAIGQFERILAGRLNYYNAADFSDDRVALSKVNFRADLIARRVPEAVSNYLFLLGELFDKRKEDLFLINNLLAACVDEVLSLHQNDDDLIFSAVEKIQQEGLYSSDFEVSDWIENKFENFESSWALKIKSPEMFDGVEDAPLLWVEDVYDEFLMFGFFGICKDACSIDENKAVLGRIGKIFNRISPDRLDASTRNNFVSGILFAN